MRKVLLNNEEIKRIEYEMLKKLDTICKKENIQYFLLGGTLLGCIRSEGFIPWDDDIDIGMLPEDYDKLIKYFNKKIIDGLRLDCLENNKEYPYPYAKVCDINSIIIEKNIKGYENSGIFIDVFRIDGRNTLKKAIKKMNYLKKLQQQWLTSFLINSETSNNLIKSIYYKIRSRWRNRYNTRKWAEIINNNSFNNNISFKNDYCATIHDKLIPTSVFKSVIYKKFEDILLPCPVGYDQYLKIKYNDYMTLPPIEERISVHSFEAYKITK